MPHKQIHTCLLLLILAFKINAQVPRDFALQQRAQSLELYFNESARRYRIDPRILRTLCYLESRFRLDAISPKGARGPMQFMPGTAARYALKNPHDPKAAIDAAAQHVRDLLRRFNGRIDLALAAYNAGEAAVEAFQKGRTIRLANGRVINAARMITGGIPPYRETQNYVRSAIRLLTATGLVTTTSASVLIKEEHLNSVRDFTIDVSAMTSASATRSNQAAALFFIEVP